MLELLPDRLRYALRDWLMTELDVSSMAEAECQGPPPAPAHPPLSGDTPAALTVLAARAAWADRIEEPPGQGWQLIDRFIRGSQGLGWATADAVDWKPGASYTRNQMFQWCGAFAAWCLGAAGLDAELRRKVLPSTVRLWSRLRGTDRHLSGAALSGVAPGDVVVVSRGVKAAGEHICIVEELGPEPGLLTTIEGNARGLGPDGEIFEGVIRRTRPLPAAAGGPGRSSAKCPLSGLSQTYEVAHAYRFAPEDFTA